MEPILIVGIILFSGFVAGEISERIGLPKVTGYILAGLILNPDLTHFLPGSFIDHTDLVTNIALAFITFSVGGTLLMSKIRKLGKTILWITLCEAEFAFVFVALFTILLGPLVAPSPEHTLLSFYIPLGVLFAALACPTDPSATLAVVHEYHARGKVSSTIMGVAAFDDILGIINYSLAAAIAGFCILNQPMEVHSVTEPFVRILVSVIGGAVFGSLLNILSKIIKKENEGVLITLILGMLSLCFGVMGMLAADELLSTMTMGIIVVNFNVKKEKIFKILERYTEELIFVLFFTLSAMHLNFSVLLSNAVLIFIFVISRSFGKYTGTFIGGKLSKASPAIMKYTAGGLIPQGGIVIGLALVIQQNPVFKPVSDIVLNVIIGATIIHEIVGPLISKFSIRRAGEIT